METFHAAVSTVFNPGSDPVLVQQANQWLNSFAASPEAWEAALAVLSSQAPSNILFFAANVLLNKARTEWVKQSGEQRAHLQAAASAKLQQVLLSTADLLVAQRLCLVLAAMVVRTGPPATSELVEHALNLVAQQHQATIRCGLTMLSEIVNEGSSLDTSRAAAIQAALQPSTDRVLGAVQQSLSVAQHNPAGGSTSTMLDAMRCLQAWSKDMAGMGHTRIQLTHIAAAFPGLFTSLFNMLGSEDAALSEEAASVLTTLVTTPPEDPQSPQEATWRATAVLSVQHLKSLQPRLSLPGDETAAIARCVALCGTALSDACAEFAAGALRLDGDPKANEVHEAAMHLGELMMTCLSRPEREVVDAALDYLININTIPVVKRAPPLRADIFASALPSLMQQARYPSGFTSWDECEEDEDSFSRFRDNQLLELLECCYGMLAARYLGLIQQALQEAGDWQGYEAGLYAIRAVSMPVKQAIFGRDRADQSLEQRDTDSLTAALQAAGLLHSIITAVCVPPAGSKAQQYLNTSPWTVKEACRLLGEYAAWFGKAGLLAQTVANTFPNNDTAMLTAKQISDVPLLGALQLCLAALPHETPRHNAAQAIRNLCVRCCDRLANNDTLPGLMTAAMQVVTPAAEVSLAKQTPSTAHNRQPLRAKKSVGGSHGGSGLADPDDELILEGLMRLVSELPIEAMPAAGLALTKTILLRAQAFAHAGTSGGNPHALQLLAESLALLASAIRFMGFPGSPAPGTVHPALQVLEAAWPVLSGVAHHEACRQQPAVVAALCEVYQRSIMSTRMSGRDLLPPLISSVTAILHTHPHPGCCEVLGTCVEMFGELKTAPQLAKMQSQALVTAVNTITAAAQAGSAAGSFDRLELVRSLYGMADLYFVFARETLLASPCLPQLIGFGCAAVTLREREPVAAALAFLTHVLGVVDKLTGEEAAHHRSQLESCMAAHGVQLVTSLIMAVADSCPRQLARPLAGLLYTILNSGVWGAAARNWLASTLQSPAFASIAAGVMNAEELGRVHNIMTRTANPLPRGRFDGFVSDLSAVLRGEAQIDVLVAYEM